MGKGAKGKGKGARRGKRKGGRGKGKIHNFFLKQHKKCFKKSRGGP